LLALTNILIPLIIVAFRHFLHSFVRETLLTSKNTNRTSAMTLIRRGYTKHINQETVGLVHRVHDSEEMCVCVCRCMEV